MLYKDKSKIHGNGLFSDVDFKKGDLIGTFEITDSIYNTKFSIEVDCVRYRAIGTVKYANHSSTPNAIVEFPNMYAKKRIKAGTEITWSYGE